MTTYVYKVNKKSRVGYHFGDWHEFFRREQPAAWGLREIICEHEAPQPGDRVIAYQSNLQEVVGTAIVQGYHLGKIILKAEEGPFPRGVKVTNLKRQDQRIGGLKAFQQGFVRTLYEIGDDDADYLLDTIRRQTATR